MIETIAPVANRERRPSDVRVQIGLAFFATLWSAIEVRGIVVFETYSPYHHILVLDQAGFRTLSFDGSTETRVLLAKRSKGSRDEGMPVPTLSGSR